MARFVFAVFLKGMAVCICIGVIFHFARGPMSHYSQKKSILKFTAENKNEKNKNDDNKVIEHKIDENKIDETWDEAKFAALSHLYDVRDVDCHGVLNNDTIAVNYAIKKSKLPEFKGIKITEHQYLHKAKNCDRFIKDRGYITSTLSKKEEDFPLAYSILAHKNAEALERLLRSIYRPQNLYCIHIDKKSKPRFFNAMNAVVGCFPNVFMAPRRINVTWSEFTVLEPELVCMEELFKRKKTWKYFINLTGQEFPLKTNRELVEILTAYKGANDIEGVLKTANKERWEKFGKPPDGLTPVKGSVHVVVNRDFVDFIVNDGRAKRLLEWVKPQVTSDETFFATIGHNPKLGLRGTFIGLSDVEQMMNRKPWYNRYKSWLDWPCAGYRLHNVCILNVGDLPHIHASPFFFANKFILKEAHVAYTCLEQRLLNRTREVHFGRSIVNTTEYANSMLVRLQLRHNYMGLSLHKRGKSIREEFQKDARFRGINVKYH